MLAVGWLSLGGCSANAPTGKIMHLCGAGGKNQINIQKAKPRGRGIFFRELCDKHVP